MLGVQVQVLLLLEQVRVVVAGTVIWGDLLLHLLVMLGDLLLVHHLLARVRPVGRTMKAAAGTQTLDEIVLVRRIREITTGATRAGMHHHVLVGLMV